MAQGLPPAKPNRYAFDIKLGTTRSDRQNCAKDFCASCAEDLCLGDLLDAKWLDQAADKAELLARACRQEAARKRKLDHDIAIIPNLKRLVRRLKGQDA
ncbi:hypothetical protein HK16_12630 [Acetobacter senegalensis]|uniref:Uncharacterized protein n=1 Tax=Acetobacter senegalensis TaxID=446692 RepID=A0A252EHW7_9PROT|nr:hypothetical protein HK16_12630 [Acetobacter senegalensis]